MEIDEKFNTLSSEKKLRIINAGLECFGQHGYKKANTDEIALKAGISKGLLFYYFKNKKNFYLYLYDFCNKVSVQSVDINEIESITDFFDMLDFGIKAKLKIMEEYPYMYDFLLRAVLFQDETIADTINDYMEKTFNDSFNTYFKNIDFSCFKEDIDPKYIYKMFIWLSEGFLSGISMNIIEVQNLTKEYGNHRGIFNLNFEVLQGEVVGFLGSNGAGKTTTIRHLMGFIRPQQGISKIFNRNSFYDAAYIQENVGYLPGEISFLDNNMTGNAFIQFMAQIKGNVPKDRLNYLVDYFELDTSIKIKKMSKGTKQKLGLIIAFMQNPSVLILDEPTSGLDPIMQNKFIELLKKEKLKGKTIFMSSHIFEEIENVCDRVLMIKGGRLVTSQNIEDLRNNRQKHYTITFSNTEYASAFARLYPDSICTQNKVSFLLCGNVNKLLGELGQYNVKDILVRNQTIEEIFQQYYRGDKNDIFIDEERA